jgi:hypothetical protein
VPFPGSNRHPSDHPVALRRRDHGPTPKEGPGEVPGLRLFGAGVVVPSCLGFRDGLIHRLDQLVQLSPVRRQPLRCLLMGRQIGWVSVCVRYEIPCWPKAASLSHIRTMNPWYLLALSLAIIQLPAPSHGPTARLGRHTSHHAISPKATSPSPAPLHAEPIRFP